MCGYLFNLNECLQIHALLLHLITMVCLFKQQAKSYHVIIYEGIIKNFVHTQKLYWVWKIMAYKYEYNQSQDPFFHKFSILFYFISFPNKILD